MRAQRSGVFANDCIEELQQRDAQPVNAPACLPVDRARL
jgi:hypothetical protein